jgi:hypothetical protein
MTLFPDVPALVRDPSPIAPGWLPDVFGRDRPVVPYLGDAGRREARAAVDPEDDEDLGDEEDLAVSQPLADEESSFDDFDDEFDDDFEEDENDPDWDHPDDVDSDEPPPGKGGGSRK